MGHLQLLNFATSHPTLAIDSYQLTVLLDQLCLFPTSVQHMTSLRTSSKSFRIIKYANCCPPCFVTIPELKQMQFELGEIAALH